MLAVVFEARLELAPETVDINEVIEEAIMNSSSQFREKGITLRLDVAEI